MTTALDQMKNPQAQRQQAKPHRHAAPTPPDRDIPTGQALALPSHQKVVASAAVTQARGALQEISQGYELIEDAIVDHAIACEQRTRVNVAARLESYWSEQAASDFFDVGTELSLAVPLPALAVSKPVASLTAAN
jgi:hypothetical protein